MRSVKTIIFGVGLILFTLLFARIMISAGSIFPEILFLMPFLFCGIYIIRMSIRDLKLENNIKKNGKEYKAVIVEYATDSTMLVNGYPLLAIRVRYFDENEMIKEEVLPTGKTLAARALYPIGKVVSIIKYGDEARISQRATDTYIANKEKLMALDIESMGYNGSARRIIKSIKCPNCGATLMIANRGTARCEYCSQLVSMDDDNLADDDGYDVSMQAREFEYKRGIRA